MRRLLRIPLFQKILFANSAIVALGAVAGTLITVWHVTSYPQDIHYELIPLFAAAGLLISYAVNHVVLRLALRPLDRLQEGVDAVRRGRRDVRVVCETPSDERFDRLIETFNQMLAQQKEDAHRLQMLSHRILQAQEEERQRVARELHDEAAQALTSLLVHLRLLERAHTPEQAQQRVQELRELTAAALEEVRRVALDLRPKILDDLGLVAALGWRVDEFNAAGGARADLHVQCLNARLPRPIELVLYRVAQEALTNVARHADAQQVTLTLRCRQGSVALSIVDDGKGFDPARLADGSADGNDGGLGLLGIRERMAMVGGSVAIESAPGQGTHLTVQVPLHSDSAAFSAPSRAIMYSDTPERNTS